MKICPKCKAEHNKPGIFCSRPCANSRGPRTEEFKQQVRAKLVGKKHTKEWYEQNTGDKHWRRRGKNLPPLEKEKECEFCGKLFKATRTARFCSQQCWKNSIEIQRTAWEKYKLDCQFKFNVYDYPDWFDLTLIEEHDWYKAKNRGDNLNGISRDHKISIKDGFDNHIDPVFISHPANCELKQHRDNQKKRTNSSLTLEELKEEITKFNSRYNS